MKNFNTKKLSIKFMCLALLCLMVFPLLVSCTPDASGDTDVTTPGADVTTDGNATEEGGDLKLVGGQNEYTILRPDSLSALYELEAAIILKNAIQSACAGNKIKIATDYKTNPVSDYEICVGEVARNGSAYNVDTSSLKSNEFIVKVCGTRIVIVGYTGYGTQKAVEWFVSQYLNVEEGALTSLSIPADFEYVGSFDFSNNIRIMTQNLLATDAEYEGYVKQDEWADRILVDLSQHTLAKRQPRILALIEKYAPDSLGVQECSASWRSYFGKKLSTIGYEFIGASKNGKIGIVYNTETLTLIEDGSIWLTEKPNSLKISKEWTNGSDGISERLAMYAVFEVKATGKRYIHFNTHVDTKKNEIIQGKQTEVILQYIEDIRKEFDGIPAVLTGDFNYNTGAPEYRLMLDGGLLAAKKESTVSTGEGSFNKFIGESYHSSPIDHILGTDEFSYLEYHVLYDMDGEYFLSDHYGVITDIEFK